MNAKQNKELNHKNIVFILTFLLIGSSAFIAETNAQIIRGHIGIGLGVTSSARVEHVHNNYVSIYVGPRRYYYDEGAFYVRGREGYTVVAAPIGARIRVLPAGYVTLHIGGTNYYCYNDVYYTYLPDEETYVVVEKPANTTEMKYDRVKLYDGTVVEGVFQGGTESSITLRVGDKDRVININEIISVTFAPSINGN